MIHHLADKVHRNVFAGAVVRVFVKTGPEDLGAFAAVEGVCDGDKSVVPAIFFDASDDFSGNLGYIRFFKLSQAIPAVSAVSGAVFSEIAKDIFPEAVTGKQ